MIDLLKAYVIAGLMTFGVVLGLFQSVGEKTNIREFIICIVIWPAIIGAIWWFFIWKK